jgi:integrase
MRANGLVFTTRYGTPIEPRNFNRSFDRCIRAARVPRITVHGTRKTCGSLLAALAVHPRVAMRILRHSKINITMEIYTETTSEGYPRRALQARRLARVNLVTAVCCCRKVKKGRSRDQNRPLACGGAKGI